MKFTFRIGVYLVVAATFATLVAIGGAYQLNVTERVDQAKAEAQSQRVVAKLGELASAKELAASSTLNYLITRSNQELERLNKAEVASQSEIADLREFVAGNAEQQGQVVALDLASGAMMSLQREAIRVRQQQDLAAAVSFVSTPAYLERGHEIDRIVDAMRRVERDLVLERQDRVAARARQHTQLIIWSALLAIALAVFAAAMLNRKREEQRQAELQLREQEKQYRMVTGSVPAMIGYVDTGHRLRFHNGALEEWLNMPAGRLDDHHLAEVLGTDTYASILPEIEAALRGERTEYERERRGKDGRTHYLAGTFIPDIDGAGRISGFFAMIIDITERRIAEEALRASEERWKFALEGAGDGVWDRNIRTGAVMYSRRYKEMLGYTDEEIPNRREEWEKRVHPEDRPRVLAELQNYLEGKSDSYASEFRMRCKDGHWKWILSRGVVVSRDADGTPLRMIGTHADISERVRQQEEITRISERLDLALQGSRLAVWDADIASDSLYLSEGWAEMLGEAPRETFTDTASLLDLIHPDDLDRVRSMNLAALKGTAPEYFVEHRVRTRSGGWKWIMSHGQVVKRDGAGRALRMTGINADISSRKELERMKNEFISVVSHELRTPLSSIVGSLGLLVRATDVSAETQTLIRVARENSQRLVRLINDILDVEKLDSGTLKIELEPVDLEVVLGAAIQANQGYAQQFGVSLAPAFDHGPARVSANFDKLMQVMANLLSNAAKFSPRGARVDVRLERIGDAYRVSVTDPGPGIPEEFKPRVFDRFAQADSSASRPRGGTGLGLAICKAIVDKLGGRIDFVSTPGMGTTFYFELQSYPVAQATAGTGGAAGVSRREAV